MTKERSAMLPLQPFFRNFPLERESEVIGQSLVDNNFLHGDGSSTETLFWQWSCNVMVSNFFTHRIVPLFLGSVPFFVVRTKVQSQCLHRMINK